MGNRMTIPQKPCSRENLTDHISARDLDSERSIWTEKSSNSLLQLYSLYTIPRYGIFARSATDTNRPNTHGSASDVELRGGGPGGLQHLPLACTQEQCSHVWRPELPSVCPDGERIHAPGDASTVTRAPVGRMTHPRHTFAFFSSPRRGLNRR